MHTVTVLPLALLLLAWSGTLSGQSIVSDFDSVKQRIRANCYDCSGGSEAELRRAVADLERMVAAGFTMAEARQLLADSYREIALTYSDRGSPEQTQLLAQHQEIYRDLLVEYPESLDVLRGFVPTADDVQVAETLVIRASAVLAEAQYILGARLAAQADSEDERAVARDHLQKAFDLATGAAKVAYGRQIADFLAGLGDRESAERVREEVESYRRATGL